MKKTLIIVCSILLLLGGNADTAVAFNLEDLLLNIYSSDGVDGITLGGGTIDNGFAFPFDVEGMTLNNAITDEISSLSVNSSVASFSVTIDSVTGLPLVTTEALGPIYAERAKTLGTKGTFKFGASATYIEFTEFEGDDVDSLIRVSDHRDYTPPNSPPVFDPEWEADDLEVTLDIEVEEYVVALFASYAILDNLDISVIVPFVDLDMKIDAHAEIIRNLSDTYTLEESEDAHDFDLNPIDDERVGDLPDDSVSGDATGIGDVMFRLKYFWKETDWAEIAIASDLKVPTGDAKDLLGSDNFTLTPFIILSKTMYEGRFNPHLNFGYEIFFADDEFSQLKYALGFDSLITKKISFTADVIGNNELSGDGVGDDLYDLSVGAKVNPWRDLVLFANVQVPLNNEGLRADFIPSVGAEISF